MLMPFRCRNRIVESLTMISLSLSMYTLFMTPIHSFNTAPQPSLLITVRPSLRPTSSLYYLDRDPVMESTPLNRLSAGASFPVGLLAIDSNMTKKCDSIPQSSQQSDRSKKPIQSHTKTWNIRYQDLLQFKREHGHCHVPQHYPPNPKLGLWVMAQRRYYKLQSRQKGSNNLSLRHQQRIRLLQEVGFEFDMKRRGSRVAKIHHVSRFEGGSNKIHAMDDFVRFMIESRYSDEEKKKAWKLRFRMYQ